MAEMKKYLDTVALGALVDQIKAEDAKALAAAKKYTDDSVALCDEAGAAASALSSAKEYTDALANGQVATNKADIAKLNGDASTEGSVAKAVADAKALVDADIAAVDGKADKNAEDIAAINHAENGILAQAKGYTDTEVAKVQGAVDTLSTGAVADNTAAIEKLNGTGEGSVAKAVADSAATLQAGIDAVSGVANQNATDIETLEGKVEALEQGTYDDTEVRGLISDNTEAIGTLGQTHATDKKALEDAIALKADQTALDAVSAVANAAATQTALEAEVKTRGEEITRVEGLVTAEAQRAAGVESGLEDRIETMEAFWAAAQADGTDSNVVDTLKEIQEYIVSDETGAAEMLASIQANAKAIEDHEALAAQTYETKEDATAKYDEVKAEIAAIPQADWNQNDPAAADYVKNRTHYESGEHTVLFEDDLGNLQDGSMGTRYFRRELEFFDSLPDVSELKCEVDGAVYECTKVDDRHYRFVNVLINGKKNDVNIIPYSEANYTNITFNYLYGEDVSGKTFRLLSGEVTIKQLDEKFIPDTIARVADVDAVETRMGIAEGKITTLEGKVSTNETAISALQEADAGIIERVAAVEAQLGDGEGSVADMIADAKAEAISEAVAAAGTAADTKDEAVLAAAKKYADDEDAKIEARVDALETDTHTHGNKALLDTYTQTEANLADAVAKKHEHSNLTVLEGITSAKVQAWDAAEGNAKAFAQGLNDTMQGVVDGIDGRVTKNAEDIAQKAAQADLTKAVERIAKNETDIASLTSSVNSFTPITADEVNALFA